MDAIRIGLLHLAFLVMIVSGLSGSRAAAQMPFEPPPRSETVPDTSVPPSSRPLTEEELKRAEALLPMLEGKQELWAMGEFVHLGPGAIPVLAKALEMPGTRTRYNAIETMSMIKHPSAVPALLHTALKPDEVGRVREHALRVAVRLDAKETVSAISFMARDPESTIRKTAAFEARYVKDRAVIPVLIGLLPDPERYVAITAQQSLGILTQHETELHDWHISTPEQRAQWAAEWLEWWKTAEATFEFPEPRKRRSRT